MTRFTRFALGLIANAGCYTIASGVTYDSDDVYAAKNAADTMRFYFFFILFLALTLAFAILGLCL